MQHHTLNDEQRRRFEQRRALDHLAERLAEQEIRQYGAHLYAVPTVTENQLKLEDPGDDWPAA